jgi:imidazolonepropionase-like amidohydrolase
MPVNDKIQWVRAGWLIDGSGGPVQEDILIGVSQGRFTRVEPFADSISPGVHFRDCSSHTILPTLIDAHVHLAFSGSKDPDLRKRQLQPTIDESRVSISQHLKEYAKYGVLVVRDGGDRHGHVIDLVPELSERGPHHVHMLATVWAWHAPGRYGRMIGRSLTKTSDLDHAFPEGAANMHHLKLIHSGLNSLEDFGQSGKPQFTFDQLQRAVHWAHAKGLTVMVHANGPEAVDQAIRAGCDSIEHGYFMGKDNLARLADRQIAWVPTVTPMDALCREGALSAHQQDTARRTRDHQMDQIRLARDLGVAMVVGSDAGSIGVDHGVAAWCEMRSLEASGLSVKSVIYAASGRSAKLLGLSDAHIIAKGERARFIVYQGKLSSIGQGAIGIDGLYIENHWY